MPALTESLEDYIEAIAELIAVDGHAHSKEIADKLKVKMPSVTGALHQLARKGLIRYSPHFPVQLTEEGKLVADRVMHRHTVLKRFFSKILSVPEERSSETACHLEHIVDEETVKRFVLFCEAIEKRTDARSLQNYLLEAMEHLARPDGDRFVTVSEMVCGETGVIASIGKNVADPEAIPVHPGDNIRADSVSDDRSACRIRCGRRKYAVPIQDAENIWVRRDS